jgi:hypothetical protein
VIFTFLICVQDDVQDYSNTIENEKFCHVLKIVFYCYFWIQVCFYYRGYFHWYYLFVKSSYTFEYMFILMSSDFHFQIQVGTLETF